MHGAETTESVIHGKNLDKGPMKFISKQLLTSLENVISQGHFFGWFPVSSLVTLWLSLAYGTLWHKF